MSDSEFVGHTFGNQYEIRELIEDNGIIHTYRAHQESLKRTVAVHVLSQKDRGEAHWTAAFMKGAEIMAQYAHPNIVPVYDFGSHQGIDYTVLRFLEGGSLQDKIRQGSVEVAEVVSVVKQVAAALDYVHSQGSVHGDPATINILLDVWGNAYLADFYLYGLLQTVDMNIVAGVPAFMAPERMLGQAPTPLSDQYALASVAFNLLTGKSPVDAGIRAFRHDARESSQVYLPEFPEAINSVMNRALAFDPAQRFATVLEFARQFEQALASLPQHVFISYSRQDTDYVLALRDFLTSNGFQVWVDDQIESGDQWFNHINDAIKSAAAVLIVMTPDAESSEWVQKEILLAKRYSKAIFPILLRGDEFPILIDLQFVDARDGELPGADFHRRLARSIIGT
jgi:serine/threonine protein kinase